MFKPGDRVKEKGCNNVYVIAGTTNIFDECPNSKYDYKVILPSGARGFIMSERFELVPENVYFLNDYRKRKAV